VEGGKSTVGNLSVWGGNISAAAPTGAGIGSGYAEQGNSTVQNLTIVGGTIIIGSSYSGIGSGPATSIGGSSIDNLTIHGGFFDCHALTSGVCFNASLLTFAGGSTMAITSGRTMTASSSPFGWQIIGLPNLYFEYLSNSSDEGLTSIPLIHLESIELTSEAVYYLTISRIAGNEPGFEREVIFNGLRARGCAFSVGSPGNYSILIRSTEPEFRGRLVHDGIPSFLVSESSDSFYSRVGVIHLAQTPRPTPPSSPTETDGFTSHWQLSNRRRGIFLPYLMYLLYVPW
jgi:hypothetical protein